MKLGVCNTGRAGEPTYDTELVQKAKKQVELFSWKNNGNDVRKYIKKSVLLYSVERIQNKYCWTIKIN